MENSFKTAADLVILMFLEAFGVDSVIVFVLVDAVRDDDDGSVS